MFIMFAFKSINMRLIIMLVLPVAIFLTVTSILEYVYIRQIILEEWQESTTLRLESAAHQIDVRLSRLLRGMQAFAQTGGTPLGDKKQAWLLKKLQEQEGVKLARLTWKEPGSADDLTDGKKEKSETTTVRRIITVSPPQYLFSPEQDVILLRAELLGKKKRPLGHLEVEVTLTHMMANLHNTAWKASKLLCLVDREGRYLAHPDPRMKGRHCLGEYDDELEKALLQAIQRNPSGTILTKSYFKDRVVGYYRLEQAPWAIMLHATGRQILEPFFRFRLYFFLSTILSVIGILALMRWGLGPTLAVIQKLSGVAAAVAQGRYLTLPVQSQDEIGRLTRSFNEMVKGLEERDLITTTFGRYVDPKVAQELLRCPVAASLGGKKREVVILMTDIRGFTPLAESLSPEITIQLLNHHFSKVIEVVHSFGGIIVDFFGDSILAFFDPLDSPVPPVIRRGLKCALQIQATVPEVSAAHPEWPPLALGIGLHAGEVVVGNIGSETRTKYGIVGSAVNLAHRIQSQAQPGEVVVSEAIYRLTHAALDVTRVITTHLKGIEEMVTLYAVRECRDPSPIP
jgi:class 3 adenylate cyclase